MHYIAHITTMTKVELKFRIYLGILWESYGLPDVSNLREIDRTTLYYLIRVHCSLIEMKPIMLYRCDVAAGNWTTLFVVTFVIILQADMMIMIYIVLA